MLLWKSPKDSNPLAREIGYPCSRHRIISQDGRIAGLQVGFSQPRRAGQDVCLINRPRPRAWVGADIAVGRVRLRRKNGHPQVACIVSATNNRDPYIVSISTGRLNVLILGSRSICHMFEVLQRSPCRGLELMCHVSDTVEAD